MEYRPCPPHLSHVCHQYHLWHHCCEWSPSQTLIFFINIFGGFIVTIRMLKMFKSSTDPQSTPTSWEVLRLPCLLHMGMLWPTDTQIFTRWATSHPVCVVLENWKACLPSTFGLLSSSSKDGPDSKALLVLVVSLVPLLPRSSKLQICPSLLLLSTP